MPKRKSRVSIMKNKMNRLRNLKRFKPNEKEVDENVQSSSRQLPNEPLLVVNSPQVNVSESLSDQYSANEETEEEGEMIEAITGTNQSEAENPSEDEDGDVGYVFILNPGIEKRITL